MSEKGNLSATHGATWNLRAQRLQWFGLVLLFLAVGLAALTDFLQREGGVATLAAFAGVGALALVVARVMLMRHKPA